MRKNRRKLLLVALIVVLAMMLAACGDDDDEDGGDDTAPTPTLEVIATEESGMGVTEAADMGDAGNGETLFTSLGCAGCHTVDSAEDGPAAPSLLGVATRAGDRVEGLDAAAYLHQSLVEPEAYVVDGFEPIMPVFADQPEENLNDLVAYLMTLDE